MAVAEISAGTPLFVSNMAQAAPSDRSLPVYTRAEVAAHVSPETGIWVIYKDGVYDITSFVEQHPGGADRIMMAKGSNIDPFWNLYQQHFTPEVASLLAPMKIGHIDQNEPSPVFDADDPYANEPERHPALHVHKPSPFNAETPVMLISDNYITPSALWYCRHHHPVPVVDPKTYALRLEVETSRVPTSKGGAPTDATYSDISENKSGLSLKDLRSKYAKHEIVATMQCGGKRRKALDVIEKTQGLKWDVGAMSNARWGGARLRDVLADQYGIRTLEDAEERA